MMHFLDDDGGYLEWLAKHPDGYVLNAERSPRPAYITLHRAGCRTISGVPASGVQWTHDYVKLCGGRSELERYAVDEIGGMAHRCGICI